MLNEEMLLLSAGISCEYHTQQTEAAMPDDFIFTPTKQFVRRIQRLKGRSTHSAVYRTLTRAAAFFLALLTAGTIWLSVDVQARKIFYSWIQEIYQNTIRVIFTSADKDFTITDYYVLKDTPEGFEPYDVTKTDTGACTTYRGADAKQFISISYSTESEHSFIYDTANAKQVSVTVNENPAVAFISGDTQTSNSMIWSVDDKIFFHIAGFMELDELVALAENIVNVSYEEIVVLGFWI